MFGFPESPSDWTTKEYLRLFTIIMFYISVRPLVQALYQKLGERQRAREKKKTEDELIQRHKQERVREKLGIEPEEESGKETVREKAPEPANSVSAQLRNRRQAREAKASKEQARKEEILNDMPSDDDVSDLIS